MKRFFRLMLLVLAGMLLWACPKNNDCPNGENALLRDYTGLDGCRWILELPGGERLEPVNLHELDFTPRDSLAVRVEYSIAEDMFSICMVGKMVHIQCITAR